jgi:hypothetical protein
MVPKEIDKFIQITNKKILILEIIQTIRRKEDRIISSFDLGVNCFYLKQHHRIQKQRFILKS